MSRRAQATVDRVRRGVVLGGIPLHLLQIPPGRDCIARGWPCTWCLSECTCLRTSLLWSRCEAVLAPRKDANEGSLSRLPTRMEDERYQQSSEDGRGRPPHQFLLVPGVALPERQSWQASTTKGW